MNHTHQTHQNTAVQAHHAENTVEPMPSYDDSLTAFRSSFITLLGAFALFFGRYGDYKKSVHIQFLINDAEEMLKTARNLSDILTKEGK